MKGIKITAYNLIHLLNNRKGEAMYSFYKSIAKSQKIPFSNGLRVIVTLLLVGLLSSSTALGQTYPVQANLSITTPCPNRLSSLFPMGSSRVTLSLFLRDAMQQDVQAKLRFTIEGQGIKLETSPSYLPTPFHLQGGVPIVLRTELEPYFNPNNLMVTGASAGTFIQNRVLPEGVYTFTVEVIEARRQVVISNKAQTILLVMENEAPTLISPQPNSVAEPNPVQNLFISWISPIVITPSLGIPINYELSIWDAPQGTDPNLAIRSLRPKETVETTRTNFVWNTTNTELVVGNWYILAVKAIDPSGELSFKNNGLSQPVMFRYGTPCLPPINPTHSDITQKGAKIAWTPIGGASQFLVEIKPKADKNDTWSELNANKNTLEVTTMLPSKAYVYRVSSVCGFMQSAPTREAELTTLPMPEQRGECTGNLSSPPVDDQTPLNALTPGSIIMASGFMVTVDEVTNTEGTKFSGTGRATFPLFGFTLRVEFKNIQVNNLLQLLSGKIVALKNDDVTFLNNQPNTNNNTFDYSNPQDTLIIPEVIDTVYQNDNGDWVVVSTDSTEVVVEPDPTGTLIIDSTGGGVVVGPGGYQPYNPGTGGNNPTGSNGDLPNKLASQRVTFTKGGYQHRNGFEPVNKNMPSNYYQSITIGDSTLLLPWKSVGTTGQDKLFATPVEDPAHTFAFQNGSAISASAEGTSYGVWVTPPPAGEDNLLALAGADTSLAGAIRVKAYSPIRRVLKVVPVGDNKPMFSAASLQTELNRIYAQALMEWEVSFTQPLQSTNWDVAPQNFVEIPKTDYSTEMRAIWQAFLAEQTYDRNAVYLFVVTGFNKADTRGYMPLRSGYGFISTAATARDAAHELGHGVFNLRHTFSPYNRYQLPESTTSNLMDYKNGTDLLKYQWDYIHDPEGGLFLFEDSEEGETVFESVLISGENSGITPNGKVISSINPVNTNYTIALGVSKTSYFVQGFTVFNEANQQVESYKWNASKGTYLNGNLTIEASSSVKLTYNVAKQPVQTRIYQLYGDGCFYQYANVSHQPGSTNVNAAGASWKMSLLHNPTTTCLEEYEKKLCEQLWERTKADPSAKGHDFTNPNNYFYKIIEGKPCLLNDLQPNPFYGVEVPVDWAATEKYFRIVYISGMGVILAPLAVEIAAQYGITVSVDYLVSKSIEFTVGASVDATIQVLMAMMVNDKSFAEATQELDYMSMFVSGIDNIYNKALLSASFACAHNGFFENGKIKEDLNPQEIVIDCIIGSIASYGGGYASGKISKKIGELTTHIKNNPGVFKKTLKEKMGLASDKVDEILLKFNITSSAIRTADDWVQALTRHPNFKNLNLSSTQLDEFVSLVSERIGGNFEGVMSGLARQLDNGTVFENFGSQITELRKHAQFADGGKWVLRYLSGDDGLRVFGGKKLQFEVKEIWDEGAKRMARTLDVVDASNPDRRIFYEFKSVKNFPPSNFKDQFTKDLKNAASLDQVKWIFDGAKIDDMAKFRTDMLGAIDKLELTEEMALKYIRTDNTSQLKEFILEKFSDLFIIK